MRAINGSVHQPNDLIDLMRTPRNETPKDFPKTLQELNKLTGMWNCSKHIKFHWTPQLTAVFFFSFLWPRGTHQVGVPGENRSIWSSKRGKMLGNETYLLALLKQFIGIKV